MSENTDVTIPIEAIDANQLSRRPEEDAWLLADKWQGHTADRRERIKTVFAEATKLLEKASAQASTVDDLVKVAAAWRDLGYL